MEQHIRTTTVEDQRAEGKASEEDARGVLVRLASIPNLTVEDLGADALPLRENDDRDKMVADVRGEAAKLARFKVAETPDEVIEEPVESLKKKLTPEEAKLTLRVLEERFTDNIYLHEDCEWSRVKAALEATPEALWSISQMEAQGHMPDVYNFDSSGFDIGTCSTETPAGARNCVYDADVVAWLKENRPQEIFKGSAVEMAKAMGIRLMSPVQYKDVLQSKGNFDAKTWSWLSTRKTGSSLRGARRDHNVFVLRDDADSHADDGAFRGSLRVLWV